MQIGTLGDSDNDKDDDKFGEIDQDCGRNTSIRSD